MTPFEQHPQLFANGSFQAKVGDHVDWINGYNSVRKTFDIRGLNNPIKVRLCTLIARPTSDMTEEELSEACEVNVAEREKGFAMGAVEHQTQYTGTFLYLLSIGVYPFNQQHFKDGTVIEAQKEQS